MIIGEQSRNELDGWVDAYESAFGTYSELELPEFLPPASHPLYRTARLELIRVDMDLCWQARRPKRVADYLALFPDLAQESTALQEMAFEEYRLSTLAGEEPSPGDYEQRYGVSTNGWCKGEPTSSVSGIRTADGANVHAALDLPTRSSQADSWLSSCHGNIARALLAENVHQSHSEAIFLLAQAMTALPEVGTDFLSFQLIAELGRGGFGRVYLARQGDLANRLVALKITIDLLDEEQKLAQLQHTNVVPIYSVHQAGPLYAVCMPYFGATTLADIIKQSQGDGSLPASGKSLVQTMRARQTAFGDKVAGVPGDPSASARGNVDGVNPQEDAPVALQMLEKATNVDAMLWLAERLCDGLVHAHERGILHRDLKPANILLTDDGQPMLLDFNLSADTKRLASFEELRIGGTLPYMSPEHLEAVLGRKKAVDARGDVYSLGVILFELLAGRLPFPTRHGTLSEIVPAMVADRLGTPRDLRVWNRDVTPAVESIVLHCLEPNPDRRYQSAHELREDLKRQRQSRPLRFAPEPSWRERNAKWLRRHPRLASPTTFGVTVLVCLLVLFAPLAWQMWRDSLTKAETDKENAELKLDQKALDQLATFNKSMVPSRSLMEATNIVQNSPGFMKAWQCEASSLNESISKGASALAIYQVVDDPRWQDRSEVCRLPVEKREKLVADIAASSYALAEAQYICLSYVAADSSQKAPLRTLLVGQGSTIDFWAIGQAVVLSRALCYSERGRQCFGETNVPKPFLLQQADLADLRGDRTDADYLYGQAEQRMHRPETEDAFWCASRRANKKDFAAALPLLIETTEHFPNHSGAWLLQGLCAQHLDNAETNWQKDSDFFRTALVSYNAYIDLNPNGVWGFYSRGELLLRQEMFVNAEKNYDHVIKLMKRNDWTDALAYAYARRARALQSRQEYSKAEEDLTEAIKLDAGATEFYYQRALIRDKLGVARSKDAELDRRHVLDHVPASHSGWRYRGILKASTDPAGALADYEKALSFEPNDEETLVQKARLLSGELKRYAEAIPVLDKILANNDSNLDALTMRGILLARLARRDLAHADASKILAQGKTAARRYRAAQIYSITSLLNSADSKIALENLVVAVRFEPELKGFHDDPYLRPLHRYPEYWSIVEALRALGGDVELTKKR